MRDWPGRKCRDTIHINCPEVETSHMQFAAMSSDRDVITTSLEIEDGGGVRRRVLWPLRSPGRWPGLVIPQSSPASPALYLSQTTEQQTGDLGA